MGKNETITKSKIKRVIRLSGILLTFLFLGFIGFVLNETKDEINANPYNIDVKIEELYDQNRMGGFAVSVFSKDCVLYQKGFGYADKLSNRKYTSETTQYIASISKTTIGIALLKAQELGLLQIVDPINQHLPFKVFNPEFPNEKITLEQLATHTSSLDYNEKVVESLYITESEKKPSLEPFMRFYFQENKYGTVKFTANRPGSDFNYSNIGAGLAAYIIEEVTDMSFNAFTKKYIFDQLKMRHTGWFLKDMDSIDFSSYYEPESKGIKQVVSVGVQLYPARDMITDIGDLTILCRAVLSKSKKLLKQESFATLLNPRFRKGITNNTIDDSGIFWMIDRNQYGVTYPLKGMNGGDNCINTMMWFDPVTELGYIFVGNTGQSDINRSRHILIFKTLVSLGDNYLLGNAQFTTMDRIKFRWHNVLSRVNGFF